MSIGDFSCRLAQKNQGLGLFEAYRKICEIEDVEALRRLELARWYEWSAGTEEGGGFSLAERVRRSSCR